MTTDERSVHLDAELASVTVGRHFARDVVRDWQLEQLVDDVQLCTSELIANAVRHAGTAVTLTLRLDTRLVVEVHDGEPELHQPFSARTVDPTAESGRGLQIVAALSDDWGVLSDVRGKSIWFTLGLPDRQGADADVYTLHRSPSADSAHGEAGGSQDSDDSARSGNAVGERARATG